MDGARWLDLHLNLFPDTQRAQRVRHPPIGSRTLIPVGICAAPGGVLHPGGRAKRSSHESAEAAHRLSSRNRLTAMQAPSARRLGVRGGSRSRNETGTRCGRRWETTSEEGSPPGVER
eukprot:scaffold273164_cov26-Tisochrysis_lutea.AAC.1